MIADVLGNSAEEIFVETFSDGGGFAFSEIFAFDRAGTQLLRFTGFRPPFGIPGTLSRGFSAGNHPGPDLDGDGLLDSWERDGINLGGTSLDLPNIGGPGVGTDPNHKDLFLELDWMYDPKLPEAPLFSCGDGADNDSDGNTDGADTDCLIYDRKLGEADPGSCNDSTDNDGDSDASDSDCITFLPAPREAPAETCGDGADNDGDGDADDADDSCDRPEPSRGEAPPGTCGDLIDNDADGLLDSLQFECHHAPTRSGIRRMIAAFCSAPLDAGGVENPDGKPGIDLWVDTGRLRDPFGSETDILPCTCGDGIDNDEGGMGLIDGADPDCLVFDPLQSEGSGTSPDCGDGMDNDSDSLVDEADPDCKVLDESRAETPIGGFTCNDSVDNDGDMLIDLLDPDCAPGVDLGGGNQIPPQKICELDDDFYVAKNANFRGRRLAFRYGMSALRHPDCGPSGGWGEVGGNDFIEFNHDGGTVMHELGHTLNLHHGGNDDRNCKPNYLSVMNYDLQGGIGQRPWGGILDYAPPRFPGGRGVVPDDLMESSLDETIGGEFGLGRTDHRNLFAFKDPSQIVRVWPVDGDSDGDGMSDGVDWNWNETLGEVGFSGNIDTSPPDGCDNDGSSSTLRGHDDWTNISLPFLGFEDASDGAINSTTDPEMTRDELVEVERQKATADVAVGASADPTPVEVGETLQLRLRVVNAGPNPAGLVEVAQRLPERSALLGEPSGCRAGMGERHCQIQGLPLRGIREFEVALGTEAACVDGLPQSLASVVSVVNTAKYGAPDPVPANNHFAIAVPGVDTTKPSVTAPPDVTAECAGPAGTPVLLGSATASDVCDPSPSVRLVSVTSSEPDDGLGDGDTEGDIQSADFGTEDRSIELRAERSGLGTGRTYEAVYEAVDASGNRNTASVTVTVPGSEG